MGFYHIKRLITWCSVYTVSYFYYLKEALEILLEILFFMTQKYLTVNSDLDLYSWFIHLEILFKIIKHIEVKKM